MAKLPTKLKALPMAMLVMAGASWAQTDSSAIEEVVIYGEQGITDTATKLDLTVFETPQTVISISRAQMDDFALNKVGDLLNYAPGITVEEVETNRTYYTARGFDIVNFQYDGVGIPFISGLNLGQQDTAIYEKVEVVKGSAGLITGLANPSATINYVRKRPTEDFQGSTGLSLGQWQAVRLDGDVSGAFTDGVRGRAVAAFDDAESYLDRHENQTQLVYGIVEFDITDAGLLTIGHSYDNHKSDGVLWGALPVAYSDGSATDFDVSTSNAPDWTFADTKQQQTFAEFKYQLAENWTLNAIATHNTNDYDSQLFYVYGALDRTTGLGLNGYASAYNREETQDNIDLFVSGGFKMAGQDHQLVFGLAHSDTTLDEASHYSSNVALGYPVLGPDWERGNSGQPVFDVHDPATGASSLDIEQKAVYLAARFNLADNLALLAGARNTDIEQTGVSYGGAANADAQETVPYLGITYEVVDTVMLYGSYSEVFKQQTWVDKDLKPLGATLGDSKEVGIKKSFNNQNANLTFALFESAQDNFGQFVGRNDLGIAIYQGVSLESKGYEIEFSGQPMAGLNIAAGFTDLEIENNQGDEIRPFVPRKTFTFSTSYSIPAVAGLRVGGVLQWQDETSTDGGLATQDSYTLLDLALQYQVTDDITLAFNAKNVTDEKYHRSLYWTQAFYGQPRNVSASVRWDF